MQLRKIQEWLGGNEKARHLLELIPVFFNALPEEVDFDSDIWDLLAWVRRKGNRKSGNVIFKRFQNSELKLLVKIYILYKRETSTVDIGVATMATASLLALDQTIGAARSALKLNNEDFAEAQAWLEQKYRRSTPAKMSNYLQDFGVWLNTFMGLRITYKSSLQSISYHGRKANQGGRDKKLIPTEVIRDLIAASSREDLIIKDRFFLSAFMINVSCGFRINETTTLPYDCLLDEERQTGIRYFPEKKGRLGVRWISESMAPAVRSCIQFLQQTTASGREIAALATASDSSYNWRSILLDKNAARYFVSKLAYEWISRPENYLFNKSGAWYEKRKVYIDVLTAIERNGGNLSAASRELSIDRATFYFLRDAQIAAKSGRLPKTADSKAERTSWDTDSRVFSMNRIIKATGVILKNNKRDWLRDIVEDAQKCQLSGNMYPEPKEMPSLEAQYRLTSYPPLIVDKNNNAVLEARDALFVLQKYALSDNRGTKPAEISYVDDKQFSWWLGGNARSKGTRNGEDSCFSRLGIIDPRTGGVASFVWHDIRHWLDTMYEKGGLSEDMIALIFGRKVSSNHVYDQTDMDTRVSRLKDSVRNGKVFGHLAETYSKLAEHSRDEAELYLKAKTIMVNPMPHGMCTNNWSAMPCPHHLGCFTGNHESSDGACEHLEVEPDDKQSIQDIQRINREASVAIEVIPIQSPQHIHFIRVEKNTRELLDKLEYAQE